jgi:hypothetical protein
MDMHDCLKYTSQMDFKRGASFWNDVLFSTKKIDSKGTIIILFSTFAPLVEEHGIIILGRV